DPEDPPDDIVEEKRGIPHLDNPGDKGCKRPDTRYKSGHNDRFLAVFLVILPGHLDMPFVDEALFTVDEPVAKGGTYLVIDRIAKDGGSGEDDDDHENIQTTACSKEPHQEEE